MSGLGLQSLFAVMVVLALVVAMAWLVRRGAFAGLRNGSRAIAVETAVPIGERRSLIIVAVEGRRLLLGLTPNQISMVTELGPVAAAAPVDPAGAGSGQSSFEQLLVSRAKDMVSSWRGPSQRAAQAPEAGPTVIVSYGDILQLNAQES